MSDTDVARSPEKLSDHVFLPVLCCLCFQTYEKNIGKGTTVSAYASGDLKKKKVNQVGFRITKRF